MRTSKVTQESATVRRTDWTHRLEYVKCGKDSCKSCPHGPYWYGYRKVAGRTKKKYIGKHYPGGNDNWTKLDVQECYLDGVFLKVTCSVELCRLVLGLPIGFDLKMAKKRFKQLSVTHGEGRRGDEHVLKRSLAAITYLTSTMKE